MHRDGVINVRKSLWRHFRNVDLIDWHELWQWYTAANEQMMNVDLLNPVYQRSDIAQWCHSHILHNNSISANVIWLSVCVKITSLQQRRASIKCGLLRVLYQCMTDVMCSVTIYRYPGAVISAFASDKKHVFFMWRVCTHAYINVSINMLE